MSSRIRDLQTTMQAGMVDAKAVGRTDVGLFSQALKDGTNWRMSASGAIDKRPGSFRLADLSNEVRLLPFEFNDDQLFIFAMSNGQVAIYDTNGTLIQTLSDAAITTNNMWDISWAQSGDFMFLAHKDFPTLEIQRTSTSTFTINDYAFDLDNEAVKQMPFTKFADSNTTLTITSSAPYILTLSAGHWEQAHEDNEVQVKVWDATNSEWEVYQIRSGTGFQSSTVAWADSLSGTPAAAATKVWIEEVVNPIRGYPGAIAFHAGRLWLGGFSSLPAHLAASKVGLFWNFDVDDGSADDAIFAPIDSDQINEIQHIVSGQHLQIFTDLSELHISEEEGAPITPTSVAVRTDTRYGSCCGNKPLVFDDATLFVQHGGNVVREFLWNSVNRGYTSNPLSLLTSDILGTVKQAAIDYGGADGPEQYCYFLNTDGNLAVYHALRSEEVNGFLPWETEGDIKSIAVVGDVLYQCVKRTINGVDKYWLEVYTENLYLDGAVSDDSGGAATATFTGFTELAGETVHVTSEDNTYYLGEYQISGAGVLDLSVNGYTAVQVWAGFNYESRAETLPVSFTLSTGKTEQLPKRIVSGYVRIDSSYDFVMAGETFVARNIIDDVSLPPASFTGVRRAHMLGAAFDRTLALVADIPLSCTVLTMGMEVAL